MSIELQGRAKMANVETQARSTIAAYFSSHSAAEQAVRELKEAGFPSSQIGLAATSARDASSYTADPSTSSETGSRTGSHTGTVAKKAGEKAEGTWAKIKNFFEGGDVEPYAEETRRGDPTSHEITTSEADDYEYGEQDVRGSLSGLSVPEERSRYFGHRLRQGSEGAVVTVNASGREPEGEAILTRNGGDVGSDAANYDYTQTSQTGTPAEGTQRIQLLGEVLRVQKERINRGEVTLRKEVITENQTINVPVTREELVIERHAVEGSTPASGQIGEGSEVRIPLSEERPSVDKSTVVREEVSVGKRNVEDTRTVTENVSREDLVVDDKTKAQYTDDPDRKR
jgi:uncharacterized protein (TIGR02271 family)